MLVKEENTRSGIHIVCFCLLSPLSLVYAAMISAIFISFICVMFLSVVAAHLLSEQWATEQGPLTFERAWEKGVRGVIYGKYVCVQITSALPDLGRSRRKAHSATDLFMQSHPPGGIDGLREKLRWCTSQIKKTNSTSEWNNKKKRREKSHRYFRQARKHSEWERERKKEGAAACAGHNNCARFRPGDSFLFALLKTCFATLETEAGDRRSALLDTSERTGKDAALTRSRCIQPSGGAGHRAGATHNSRRTTTPAPKENPSSVDMLLVHAPPPPLRITGFFLQFISW